MKKLILSSVAVLALSFAANANTIEEKVEIAVVKEDCAKIYKQEYDCWRSEGYTDSQARAKASVAYYDCGRQNYNEEQLERAENFKKQ